MPSGWVDEVLNFWFGELSEPAWFRKDPAVDETIVQRFSGLHDDLATRQPSILTQDGRTALAAVIALDQFPRNMYRGSAKAFATDALARTVARSALVAELDAGMTKHERLFLYLPFEHSEDAADQDLSVRLISALGDPELTRYAVAHKDIVDRFGRFPHRNAALARESTAEEIAFLQQPGSSF